MHNIILFSNVPEVILGMRNSAEIMILNFNDIHPLTPEHKNIAHFFEKCLKEGRNPKSAEERQKFNENFLKISKKKVLIGRYGEDRATMLTGSSIAQEGRTIHLGIDLFTIGLEEVFCPLEGEVVAVGFEPEPHGYGYWIIIKHELGEEIVYTFYGHLGRHLRAKKKVHAGERIGNIGDFSDGENGGWSRHLHFQILDILPPDGLTPNGYATPNQFAKRMNEQLDPNRILQLPLSQARCTNSP